MKIPDIIKIHKELHAGTTGEEKNSPLKQFRVTTVGDLEFVTQNMRKHSGNTRWINEDPTHRRLTWVFKNSKYTGKIREFRNDSGKQVIEVYRLNPETLAHQEVEE